MQRPQTKNLLSILQNEQRSLDEQIEYLITAVTEQRITQKAQQAAFMQKALGADFSSDLEQLNAKLNLVKLRLTGFCNLTFQNEADTSIQQLISFKQDLKSQQLKLQSQLNQFEQNFVVDQMNSTEELSKLFKDCQRSFTAFNSTQNEYKKHTFRYLQNLKQFVRIKSELQNIKVDELKQLRKIQNGLKAMLM
ncbi:Hypothetical_protein [Hexamita inflata]|uniref:Hypothetical_protein n=1 Tax=Hexamita inflata TaxID=28002 RepID=A0AA86N509_9EUKA|nr:Hypothetical protein HINF_LOCUS500 [Hexamita inflata]